MSSIRFFEQLLPRLQTVPGVETATLSDGLPAAGNGNLKLTAIGWLDVVMDSRPAVPPARG